MGLTLLTLLTFPENAGPQFTEEARCGEGFLKGEHKDGHEIWYY